MLPDFPEVKSQMRAVLTTQLDRAINSTGVLAGVTAKRQYEGDRFSSTSFDGHRRNDAFHKSEASFGVTKAELLAAGNSMQLFAEKLQGMAQEFVKDREGLAFRKLNEVTNATGNDHVDSMKAKGRLC